MKVLCIGLGSIGQKYYNLLADHFDDFDIFALRSRIYERNEFKCLPLHYNLYDWNEVDSIKPDVAIITNPTHLHIETAIKCAERGMHIFITKPLDCKINYSLTHLKNIVKNKGLTTHIAYPLRHLPIVKRLKRESYENTTMHFVCKTDLAKWRSYSTYSAEYSEGGGVLLELSHELDLAAYLLGDVLKIDGYTHNLPGTTTDAEDIADLTLSHKNGNTSYHRLNIASRKEERFIIFDTERYEIQVDDSIFLDQLRYFFSHIGKPIMNDIFEASKLFNLLMEFRNATRSDSG